MRTRFVFKVCLNKIKEKQLCGDVMVLSLRLFGVLRVPPSHAVQIHRREGAQAGVRCSLHVLLRSLVAVFSSLKGLHLPHHTLPGVVDEADVLLVR